MESEYVDSWEYVQEEQDQFQAEDITRKMTVTLTPFLALLCLESRFHRYMLAAYHMIYMPSAFAMKPQTLPCPSKYCLAK